MYRERSTRLRRLLPTGVLFLLTLALATATDFFAGAPAAQAQNVTCSGTLGGGSTVTNINGNVTVPDNASCTLSFVNVKGNVMAGRNSTLLITAYTEPSTIGGNVQAQQCNSALLEGNVTVSGNVQIQSCTGAGPNGFQGPDTVIQGNFLCQTNSSNLTPCLAWLGRVNGNVEIHGNVAPTPSDVSLVSVGGNLNCDQNSQAPTHLHGSSWVGGHSQNQCAAFATVTTEIDSPVAPAASCAALASLPSGGFPVPNTVITSAVDTPAAGGLPERCIINGFVNKHVSPVDNCTYLNGFQVQLPLRANWNGRFMFQGGGGTEGSVPTATGTDSGSAGSNFGILNGYAVASQDGGHENSLLAACGKTTLEFYLDPMGLVGNGYQSIEVATLTAKYLMNQYYGNDPQRSYWVGCSEGGRQGMVMSQTFPSFFDGIVAGDPVYDVEAVNLSEMWSVQQMVSAYNADASRLPPLAYVSGTPPLPPQEPIVNPVYPTSDQALFETALLQACDALDGVTDGVIDNLPACQATFDPATATYVDFAGVLGPANTRYSLQCSAAKNATCLTPAQIQAAKAIAQGARTNNGKAIQAPAGAVSQDPVDNTVFGYAYDGGWMTTVSIPSRDIGGATSAPGNEGQFDQFPYYGVSPSDPAFGGALGALAFNFNSAADFNMLTAATPKIQYSTSLDIGQFIKYGHKIIWYHGLSDPGPPVTGTITYYNQMAQQFGGFQAAQNFSRLYPVPNLDHCTGGATTDQFDLLTPLVNWVENGTAPGPVTAKGVNFNATTYQVVGNYITSGFVNAPTTRSRPLCPYPQQARFTGATTLTSGVPVATNPADLANASNYTCVQPPN